MSNHYLHWNGEYWAARSKGRNNRFFDMHEAKVLPMAIATDYQIELGEFWLKKARYYAWEEWANGANDTCFRIFPNIRVYS